MEGHESSRDMRLNREGGELRDTEANIGKKAKCKLERSCKGSEWLTVLTRSQAGTDLSMEELIYSLQWHLDLPLQTLSPGILWL